MSTKKIILLIGSQCVNKQCQDFPCHKQWHFQSQWPSQWSMNMVKVLSLRSKQCFGPFTTLPVKGFSEARLFTHLSNHVFRSPYFGNTYAMRVIFFWKCLKFNLDLNNAQNNSEKAFCFWDKCIWICCVKILLLRREYLSSAVNYLTDSLKIFHVTKREPFQLN